MSQIEKIQRYIERTKIPESTAERFELRTEDFLAFYLPIMNGASDEETWRLISLAFRFGMAKGYRAAKKEVAVK